MEEHRDHLLSLFLSNLWDRCKQKLLSDFLLRLLQLEASTPLKTFFFRYLKRFNQQQKWFQPSREVNVSALLSGFLPQAYLTVCPCIFQPSPLSTRSVWLGCHTQEPVTVLHPCCQQYAVPRQWALFKAANSELNKFGEGSPSLNEIQPHLMIIGVVLLKQSASTRQAQVWSLTDVGILWKLKVVLPALPSVQPVHRLGTDSHAFADVQVVSLPLTKIKVKSES